MTPHSVASTTPALSLHLPVRPLSARAGTGARLVGWAPTHGVGDAAPSREEARALGQSYELVPVYREVLADTLAPVTAFALLGDDDEPGFLLEGVEGSQRQARYSYVGYRPQPLDLGDGDPLLALAPLVNQRIAPVGLPAFHGGVVGYLGYEAARHFERIPLAAGPPPGLPTSAFLLVENLVLFDHVTRCLKLVTIHRPNREGYDDALRRIDEMAARLSVPRLHSFNRPVGGDYCDYWQPTVTRERFEEMVLTAQNHILAGDAFQIVPSQRFSKPLRSRPLDIYRCLRAVNPAPYMYHLRLGGDGHVVGTSPELLVRSQGARIETRPLAGTRPRGMTAALDARLERELVADIKERAEHVMLVDLGRNDIGRVAVPGTVDVERVMQVERYSHVMHLSSTVTGVLAEGKTSLDAIRATFPAGTVSGAPKIRAMEIIADLEPEQRGAYAGALGYVGFNGDLDLAITLRTIVIADGTCYVQAGAGVVADSDPSFEYHETLHKAEAMFAAVAHAEAMV